MAQWSALDILQQTAAELGLPQPMALPEEVVSTTQLVAMLNSAGAELVYAYPWTYLTKTWKVDIQAGKTEYKLPKDWGYMLNQTSWNSEEGSRLQAPQSPQLWSWLQHSQVGNTAGVTRYRFIDNSIEIYPEPTDSGELSIQYVSDHWVKHDADAQDRILLSNDTPKHNPWLMVKYTKVKYLTLKGLDAGQSMNEFSNLLNTILGKDRGAPVLSLSGKASSNLLGPWSVPEGSWNV